MNDADKKMLTEWMGECFHNFKEKKYHFPILSCTHCGVSGDGNPQSRPFTTPRDVFDVKDRLVEKGLWDGFESFAWGRWGRGTPKVLGFAPWLFRTVNEKGEPHFCRLVAEFKPWENEARV